MAITTYVCEYCGKSFSILEDAQKCEERHVKPMDVIVWTYKNDNKKQPDKIQLEMSDGSKVWYYRRAG